VIVQRTLRTGVEVPNVTAASTRAALLALIQVNMNAADEFVHLCHDPSYILSHVSVAELLIHKNLVEAVAGDGLASVHRDTRAVVAAATELTDGEWDFQVRDYEDLFMQQPPERCIKPRTLCVRGRSIL